MTQAIEQFIALAKQHLSEYLDKSGASLYSAAHTLRPGAVYLLGTNPGGSNDGKDTLRASLEALPRKTNNSYLDESWDTHPGRVGQAPLQRRVDAILKELGLNTRDVCAGNLVFQRTAHIPGLDFWKAAESCWPVQEAILRVVQPNLVLAFGNSDTSAFAFLRKKLPVVESIPPIPAHHGVWECRAFRTEHEGRSLCIVGLPHLSYYSPFESTGKIRPHLAGWLSAALRPSIPA